MYEIDEKLNSYYKITDPTARRAEFNSVSKEVDEEYVTLSKKYFEIRHSGKRGVDLAIDKFLYNCVVLVSLNKGNRFFKKSHRKEVINLFKETGLFDIENEKEKAALYWEFRNAARRYFETCKSPSYKRKLFGAMNSTEDAKRDFMEEDAYKMSRGIGERLEVTEEIALWTLAVEDELVRFKEI